MEFFAFIGIAVVVGGAVYGLARIRPFFATPEEASLNDQYLRRFFGG